MIALPPSPNLPFADVVDLVAFGRAKMAFGLSDIDEHAAQLRAGCGRRPMPQRKPSDTATTSRHHFWLTIARKHRKGCASRRVIWKGWCSSGSGRFSRPGSTSVTRSHRSILMLARLMRPCETHSGFQSDGSPRRRRDEKPRPGNCRAGNRSGRSDRNPPEPSRRSWSSLRRIIPTCRAPSRRCKHPIASPTKNITASTPSFW
jgi:hypothetical protein